MAFDLDLEDEVTFLRQGRQFWQGAFSSGFHLLQFIVSKSYYLNHHQACQLDLAKSTMREFPL